MRNSTELIHAGDHVTAGATPSLTIPIYQTSTFVFESAAQVDAYQQARAPGYLYSRYENPTVVAVEQQLAAVDGAEAARTTSSGTCCRALASRDASCHSTNCRTLGGSLGQRLASCGWNRQSTRRFAASICEGSPRHAAPPGLFPRSTTLLPRL
jgi:hypothetical protein